MEFVLGSTTVTYYKKSHLLAIKGLLHDVGHQTHVTFLDFNTLIDWPMHLNGKPFDGQGQKYVFYYDYDYWTSENGFIRTLCVPRVAVYESEWQVIKNVQRLRRLQRWIIKRYRTPKRKVAFAMALHKHIGCRSVAHGLGIDCANTILRLLPK